MIWFKIKNIEICMCIKERTWKFQKKKEKKDGLYYTGKASESLSRKSKKKFFLRN